MKDKSTEAGCETSYPWANEKVPDARREEEGIHFVRRRRSNEAGGTFSFAQGFTLIEIMVAITIMGALTVLTAQSITKAIRTKKKISEEIDITSVMKDVLRVIEYDINMAFNYRDIHYEVLKEIKEEQNKAKTPKTHVTPGKPGDPGQPAVPPPEKPDTQGGQNKDPLFELGEPPKKLTHFLGEADNLNFTTLSNVRTLIDSQESDQAEVGYFLKKCTRRGHRDKSTDCLWRRLSPYIDENVAEGGNELAILEDVEKFELRYFGEQMDEWQKQWRSDDKGRPETQKLFPQAVQIRLTVRDPEIKNKKYTMVMVAAVRFPNNPPAKEDNTNVKKEPNDDVTPPPGN